MASPYRIIVYLSFVFTAVGQQMPVKPVNTAGVIGAGNRAIMNCSVTDLNRRTFEWLDMSKTDNNQIFNSIDNRIEDPYAGMYSVTGTYNLVFENIAQAHGHLHKCRVTSGTKVEGLAEFTALDPLIMTASTPVADGQKTHVLCEARYYGNVMPTMRFIDYNNDVITTDVFNSTVGNLARYELNKTVSWQDHGKVIKCERVFNPSPPSFTDQFSLPLDVQFSVRQNPAPVIYPSPGPNAEYVNVAYGQYINCTALGNPSPAYQWHRKEGSGPTTVMGQNMQVSADMRGMNRYTCIATNIVSGNQANATSEIAFFAGVSSGRKEQGALYFVVLGVFLTYFYQRDTL